MQINFSLYPEKLCLDESIAKKVKGVLKLYLITLGFSAIFAIPALILNSFIASQYHFSIMKNNGAFSNNMTLQFRYLIIPFIGPLIEEILFRLWQDYKVRNIVISLTLLIFEIFHFFSFKNYASNYNFLPFITHISICAIVCVIAAIPFYKFGTIGLSEKNRKKIFFLSALVFGLIHISNYATLHYQVLYIYPIFVLPQIVMGFTIGYARLTYGFVWGFLLHVIINLPTAIFNFHH